MPRDLLLVLLVVGVTLNIALVVFVAWANHRATRRMRPIEAVDPGAPVASDDMDPARLLAVGAGLVDHDWIDTQLAGEPSSAGRALEPATAPAAHDPTRPVTAEPPRTDAPPRAPESDPAGRRPRRFVLPDRGESQDRSQRAIEAFFGDPDPAPDPAARAGRRRHRVLRPPGAPVPRTDLVLTLGAGRPDARVVQAVSHALRGTVRDTDQVVELPGGRLQVTLEADQRGSDAFLRRARTVLRPWLGVIDPDLELRVERGSRGGRRSGAATS